MKRKWLKVTGIVAGVLVVLMIVLVILARVLITPERVRAVVLPLAEEHLHRSVELEKIEVGLFSGISCRGLVIGEREGDESFVRAEAVELRYRFWPLLLGRVMIDEVRLRDPALRVVRHADGTFNFSDLLAPAESEAAAPPRPEPEEKEGAPISLLISSVAVAGGQIEFVDGAVAPGRTVETRLSDLDLTAEDISLVDAFPVTIAFRLNGAPLSWRGRIDPAKKGGEGRLRIEGLDVAPLSPYFAEALPGRLQSLVVNADVQLEGGLSAISSEGAVRLENIGLSLDALPDAPIRNALLELDHALAADLEKGEVTVRSLRCVYNRLALELTGQVSDYLAAPRLDLLLKLPEVTLVDAVQSLPAGLTRDLGDSDFSGSLSGTVRLEGPLSDLETLLAEGELNLKGVGARAAHLKPTLDGVLHLDRGKVAGQGLRITAGGNELLADIRAERLFTKPVYLATTLRADTLKVDPLLPPETAGEKGPSVPAPAAGGEGEEPGPFDLPLEIEGQVLVGQVLYKELSVKDFALDWRLAQNVLSITRMDGLAASGSIKSTASVDLKRKGLAYDTNLQARRIDAASLVETFFPKASGTVSGSLDLSMNLSGTGTQPERIKRNLRGDGSFAIRDGQLTGAGLMQGLGAFLDLDDLRVFRFGLGEGTFNIRDGAVHVDASFTGSKAGLYSSGQVDFENSLDLRIKTRLSPENTRNLAGKGTFGELVADEQGWGLVPLKVTGTFSRPRVSLDRAAMAEQVKKGAKRKLQEKVEEKVLEKLGPPPAEGEEEDPAKKLLRDTLRGLMGN